MTQSDVLNLLKKEKKWMSSKEINKMLDFNAACTNLSKLFEQNLVFRKEKRKHLTTKKYYIFKIR